MQLLLHSAFRKCFVKHAEKTLHKQDSLILCLKKKIIKNIFSQTCPWLLSKFWEIHLAYLKIPATILSSYIHSLNFLQFSFKKWGRKKGQLGQKFPHCWTQEWSLVRASYLKFHRLLKTYGKNCVLLSSWLPDTVMIKGSWLPITTTRSKTNHV